MNNVDCRLLEPDSSHPPGVVSALALAILAFSCHGKYVIDEAVINRFLRVEIKVAVSIPLDNLFGLPCSIDEDLVEALAQADNLVGLDDDVRRLTLRAA